ncbi:hypothetical protein GCM10009582_01060 [Arthrobacter flavus]
MTAGVAGDNVGDAAGFLVKGVEAPEAASAKHECHHAYNNALPIQKIPEAPEQWQPGPPQLGLSRDCGVQLVLWKLNLRALSNPPINPPSSPPKVRRSRVWAMPC